VQWMLLRSRSEPVASRVFRDMASSFTDGSCVQFQMREDRDICSDSHRRKLEETPLVGAQILPWVLGTLRKSQVRNRWKTDLNQSLKCLHIFAAFPHSHPNFMICPSRTQYPKRTTVFIVRKNNGQGHLSPFAPPPPSYAYGDTIRC
jgi:hypothetical protein